MTIYHTHHIVPKFMGGTDDPSNLIRLTIEEHAEAHRNLYEEYGRWQDKLAWYGLAKLCSSSEATLQAHVYLKGKTYEEAYGAEKAAKLRASRSESNRRRVGYKPKKYKPRDISSNDIKVSCLGCNRQTSASAFGKHLRKCF